MLGWMNHKLEKDCQEKYQQPHICRWHYPNGRKWWGTKEPLDEEWKRGVRKADLKLNIQKTKIMASGPITWWQVEGEREGNGTPLQCSCLENPRNEGAWWAAIYGVTQSRTQLKWLSSRFVIASLKELVSFNFIAAVTIHIDFGAQENKIFHCFPSSPSICHEMMELDAMILVFWILSFEAAFSLSSSMLIKRLFSSSSLFASRVVSSEYLMLLMFFLKILIPSLQFIPRGISNDVICI